MRYLASLLLASAPIMAGDPVHTAKDLTPELQPLAWMLGNWEGEGSIGSVAYNRWSRFWPSDSGLFLFQTTHAADTSGNVIQENFSLFWHDGDQLRCHLFEAGPARVSALDVRIEECSLLAIPQEEGGPRFEFRKVGGTEFKHSFARNDSRDDGTNRRSQNDHPPLEAAGLSEALTDLKQALGEFEGEGTESAGESRIPFQERLVVRPILSGEFLEIVSNASGPEKPRTTVTLLWKQGDRWILEQPDYPAAVRYEGSLSDGVLKFKCMNMRGGGSQTMTLAWTEEGYSKRSEINRWFSEAKGRRLK